LQFTLGEPGQGFSVEVTDAKVCGAEPEMAPGVLVIEVAVVRTVVEIREPGARVLRVMIVAFPGMRECKPVQGFPVVAKHRAGIAAAPEPQITL
jgi:hypothetical protein